MTKEEEESSNENCLYIKLETLQKMIIYAELAEKDSNEIGGLMIIDEPKEGGLVLEDIILPEQEVGSVSFKMIPKGEWLKELTKSGKISKVKGWWHSHRHMGTFYSGVDDDTLEDKWNGESPLTSHYSVGLVLSLPSNVKAWIAYYKPIAMKKAELPIKILYPPLTEAVQKQCEAEVKERVKDAYKNWNKATYPSAAKTGGDTEKAGTNLPKHFNMNAVDPATGYSYKELQKLGLWDPDIDLIDEDPDKPPRPEWDERTCLLQCYNEKARIICWKFGKNFDCNTCKHRIPLLPNKADAPASPPEKAIQKTISEPSEIVKIELKEDEKPLKR